MITNIQPHHIAQINSNTKFNRVSFSSNNNQPVYEKSSSLETNVNPDTNKLFKKFFGKIISSDNGLNQFATKTLKNFSDRLKTTLEKNADMLLASERLLEYDKMKKSGSSNEQIEKYAFEDSQTINQANIFAAQNEELHNHMFGYPANMSEDSAVVKYLRHKECDLYFMNNCGDPYETGNYQMDSKLYEKKILNLFYDKFKIDPNKGWGYITSGGSESNKWGIYNGFKKYPNGRLYFCESSHYSIEKSVQNGENTLYPHTMIKQENQNEESIDKQELFKEIKANWDKNKEPAILLLTWGTTKTGAIDDIKNIKLWLEENEIPHYIHLDAALFGGVPNNQEESPIVPPLDEIGADSISVSFHKYFGCNGVNSIVLAKEKASGNYISYIGQTDDTTAGSRSIQPFSTFQRVKEITERSNSEDYYKNINIFKNLLDENEIDYYKDKSSNIFVIKKPSDEICKYYQLSTFSDKQGNDLAHIIIFPSHKVDVMEKFVKDLSDDNENKLHIEELKQLFSSFDEEINNYMSK